MSIIYNPEDGAEIKDVYYKSVLYFSSKEGKEFKTDSLLKVQDDVALFMTELFEFLKIVTPEEAKKIIERQTSEFKCDKCDFKSAAKIALIGHMRSHENEVKVDELGIPVLGGTPKEEAIIDTQAKWDEADKQAGLTGEGLVIESKGGAVFK